MRTFAVPLKTLIATSVVVVVAVVVAVAVADVVVDGSSDEAAFVRARTLLELNKRRQSTWSIVRAECCYDNC